MLTGRKMHQTPDSPGKKQNKQKTPPKQLSQQNVSLTTSKTLFILIEGNVCGRFLQAVLQLWVQKTSDEPSQLAVALCPSSAVLNEKAKIDIYRRFNSQLVLHDNVKFSAETTEFSGLLRGANI